MKTPEQLENFSDHYRIGYAAAQYDAEADLARQNRMEQTTHPPAAPVAILGGFCQTCGRSLDICICIKKKGDK